GRGGGREELDAGGRERCEPRVVAALGERRGELQGVTHPAAGAHGVRQHGDGEASAHPGAPVSASPARRAAAALEGATTTPASRSSRSCRRASCGSPAVPHTRATTGTRDARSATAG